MYTSGVLTANNQQNLIDQLATGLTDSGISRISIPLIALALVIEILVTIYSNRPLNKKDIQVNVLLGLAIIGSVLVVKGWEIFVFSAIWKHAVFTIPVNILTWIACLIAYDFLFYWFHRLGHEVNFLWAAHNTHHSSIEFNFTVGARNNILHVFYRFLFWSPLCLVGFHPIMVMTIDSLCTTQQFFLHTQKIKKLGVLDYLIGTPSNHRVHHGCNEEYLDKNYGAFFMVWDHIFGTFIAEGKPVKYGLTTGEVSYSFFSLVFGYWILIFQRIKSGGSIVKNIFGKPSK
jgi:sterol desaturase/sphingolipid hydroxylase (fatty acid hydroxylase superfamily)